MLLRAFQARGSQHSASSVQYSAVAGDVFGNLSRPAPPQDESVPTALPVH
jgi:hypothetical protein